MFTKLLTPFFVSTDSLSHIRLQVRQFRTNRYLIGCKVFR